MPKVTAAERRLYYSPSKHTMPAKGHKHLTMMQHILPLLPSMCFPAPHRQGHGKHRHPAIYDM